MRSTALLLVCVFVCSSVAAERRAVRSHTANRSPATHQQADKTEALMNQRIGAIEQGLAREEKILQSRLAEIQKMRNAAITKNDEKALKNIEQLERNAVEGYQKRVNGLIAGISAPASSTPQKPVAQTRPTPQTRRASTTQQKRRDPRNPRMRFWPFRK